MRADLVADLRCPADGAPLAIQDLGHAGSLISRSTIACTVCGTAFQVADGITDLRVLVGDERVVAAKRKEIAVRDSEAHEVYDRIVGGYRTRLEAECILRNLGSVAGKMILDLGCGTGRITRWLVERGAQVIGIDYSIASLREAQDKVGGDGRGLDLLAADVTALPFPPTYFDLVVSSQVLEHLVDGQQRELMFRSIARVLRPGGLALITTYNYDRSMKKSLGPGVRQGRSSKGVPFFCYEKKELAADLTRSMDVKRLLCIDHQIGRGLPCRLGVPLGLWLDRLVTRSPLAWSTGHVLVAVCSRH
ncbi:MAG: class I SAM-dependent methyltransferase [Chloroflexi bacterium]|nr:class I SAM-dependent methyltransferase [Chloroflexota bacterium]